MRKDIDPAGALGFCDDLAGFADGRNHIVAAHVTQCWNALLRQEFLALLQFPDLRFDLEFLALCEGNLLLLCGHGLCVGEGLRAARREDIRHRTGLDVFLLAVLHSVSPDNDLVAFHLFQTSLFPLPFLAGSDGFDLAFAEVNVIALRGIYFVPGDDHPLLALADCLGEKYYLINGKVNTRCLSFDRQLRTVGSRPGRGLCGSVGGSPGFVNILHTGFGRRTYKTV